MDLIVIVSCRDTRWRNLQAHPQTKRRREDSSGPKERTEMSKERRIGNVSRSFITTLYSSGFIVSSYTSYSQRDLWRGSGTIHEFLSRHLSCFRGFSCNLVMMIIHSLPRLSLEIDDAICAKSTEFCRVPFDTQWFSFSRYLRSQLQKEIQRLLKQDWYRQWNLYETIEWMVIYD